MRSRALVSACGLVVLLLATTGVRGCREEAAKTFNPNRAPDTYLTAAPVESTTTSYLFHLYWNGTDPDGEVVGFYVAVTDSNLEPDPDSLSWTTRTDSSIAFKVAGTTQTLAHRFYVSAVDNEGRLDPSPAWVYFEAFDQYFPEPIFLEARAVEYLTGGGERSFTITDNESEFGVRDTIPIVDQGVSDSVVVYFKWTGIDRDRFGHVTGFRYRMTGDAGYTDLIGVDTVSVRYKGLPSGVQIFGVAGLDDAGAQTDPDSQRVFVSNFDPDTWFDREFKEIRTVDGEEVEIMHTENDTVAVGSTLEFTVYGDDVDGDNELLQYSYTFFQKKTCGGGSNPAFTFFDPDNRGSVYHFSFDVSKKPSEGGQLKALARTKDVHGRIDGSSAVFIFYSNLPPDVPLSGVVLNDTYTIDSPTVAVPGGVLTVTVDGATDPDPGTGTGELDARVILDGTIGGIEYNKDTGWSTSSAAYVLSGLPESGRYKISVEVRDEGCRVKKISRELNLTL
jgi:hypothetical protein